MNLNYQYLFLKKKIFRVLMTFLFLLDMALLYFLIIKFINDGIIHIYFYLMISIGFYISFPIMKKIRKK